MDLEGFPNILEVFGSIWTFFKILTFCDFMCILQAIFGISCFFEKIDFWWQLWASGPIRRVPHRNSTSGDFPKTPKQFIWIHFLWICYFDLIFCLRYQKLEAGHSLIFLQFSKMCVEGKMDSMLKA